MDETPVPDQDDAAQEPQAPEAAEPATPDVPTPALPEVEPAPAADVVADAPPAEDVVAEAKPADEVVAEAPSAAEVVADAPPVEQVVAEAEAAAPAESVDAADAPATETAAEPAPAAEGAPAPAEGAPAPAEGAPAGEGEGGKRKRPRRRKGSKVAEQWGVSKTKVQGLAAANVDLTSPPAGQGPKRPSRGGGRSREPLPFDELRSAAQAVTDMEGSRKALRDAFGELAPRERNDISQLVSEDGDFRQRARKISAGSLAARKIGKALAAQQVAIASLEDVWAITLSKEEAAERLSRVRAAKNRDRERARRNEERNNRADRVSREDLKKAQDGRVGAQIRFVIAGEDEKKRDRKKKPAKETTANDLLDRLGY